MPIDDTDDKVRRNVVAFSALVLAAAWLGFPELWLLSLLTTETSTPPAWKVTLLALCVHVYLIARYWFSTAHEIGRNVMEKDWLRIFHRIRNQMITEALTNYHLTKKQPTFIETDLAVYAEHQIKSRYKDSWQDFNLQFIKIHINSASNWYGSITTERIITDTKLTTTSSGGDSLNFRFPAHEKRKLLLKTAFKQVIYSHTTVEYFVPIVLAAGAMSVLLQKLVRNLI